MRTAREKDKAKRLIMIAPKGEKPSYIEAVKHD
jgi:hypothetical protein